MTTTIVRGILKGTLFNVVQTRNMFTAEVVLAGNDTLEDVMNDYIGTIINELAPVVTSDWACTTCETQAWSTGTWFTIDERAFVMGGTASGDPLANVVASVLIGTLTAYHGHARKFFGGIAESMAQGNVLTSPGLAAMALALVNYIGPYTSNAGSVLYPGVLDKTKTFRRITGGFVSQLLGTMRRRKPGLGI